MVRLDVSNPAEIRRGILEILGENYETMVHNSIQAIKSKYNWELEEKKIFRTIKRIEALER